MIASHHSLWRGLLCGGLLTIVLCFDPPSSLGQDQSDTNRLEGIRLVAVKQGANDAQGLLGNVQFDGARGAKGVVVDGPAFLRTPEFKAMMTKYIGQPLSSSWISTLLPAIQTDIIKYCRTHGHLVVDVFYPEQDLPENIIQIVVIEAKISKINVDNPGHKWFSDSVVLRDVSLKKGDVVSQENLAKDLSWLNRNSYQSLGYDGFSAPFRDVNASFQQGELGATEVTLHVQDRFPLRPFAGYDDAGFKLIGEDRFNVGFNWANAFGIDHRINFQFTSDTDFNKFKSYAGSYIVPLPWHHELVFFGAYADIDPDYTVLNDPNFHKLKNSGTAYQASMRYVIPLTSGHNVDQAISAGFDYKNTDSPLFYNQSILNSIRLKNNHIEVGQFTLDYSAQIRDRHGVSAFAIGGVYSPGGLFPHNHDSDFSEFAFPAKAQYEYAHGEIRRETILPANFSWLIRGGGQYSPDKLVPSETFGLGGFATVRGYNERVVNGDGGVLLVNELRTPPFVISNITGKENAKDWIMALIFADYGYAFTQDTAAGYKDSYSLLGIGAGVRFEIADNVRVRFDYGYQLLRDYATSPSAILEDQPHGRVHLGAEVSF
ncbi:MAG TPA: ShlB/FhaC/HecB family hemolysin secretion/activation protein [Candidatus Dormibacteraeota bacterium]|nr:ShlB/FhaC/HecB family hemolysin secretion/activation protein [Candidatus Dormibacteraeota bacterium]